MMLKKMKKMRAVMMEYVIIAVMIAAAVVVAVMMFGDTIKGEFTVASQAMTNPSAAASAHSAQVSRTSGMTSKANANATAFHGNNLDSGSGGNR